MGPIIELIAHLNLLSNVNFAVAAGARGAPLYSFFLGMVAFYGPSHFRGEAAGTKHETLMFATTYLVPVTAVDLFIPQLVPHRALIGHLCLCAQVFGILAGSKYLPFVNDTYGDIVQGAIDKVTVIIPAVNDGSTGGKSGVSTRSSARRVASPASKKNK